METLKKKQLYIKPVLSEKSLTAYKTNKICTFWIESKSTKPELSKEFEELFGIKPLLITTVVSRKNRNVRTLRTTSTNRKYVKKAYVNIGDKTLDIFENIS